MPHEQIILQLGDLHFCEFQAATTDVDTHDSSTPGQLDATLGYPIPREVHRAIVDQLNASPGAIVAVCGDITSRGDRDGFVGGVRYLAEVLGDSRLVEKIGPDRLHVVPGNHDVNFKGDQPFVSFEDLDRFEVLAQICVHEGLGDVFTRSHRETTVALPDGGGVSVVSVNTCRGVGATRRDLPAGAKDLVLEAALNELDGLDLDAAIERHSPGVALEEVLDVPLLHPDELQGIAACWGHLNGTVVPVLLAHHGLLPQHTPRLNPYTEMANAGQARRQLTKLGRSVLYLHGHIHQHVVEIVDFPKANDILPLHDRAVIIAAPELRSGFNKIAIKFDAQGRPLGIRVEKYRISQGEQTISLEPDLIEVSLARRPSLTAAQRNLLAFVVQNSAATGGELVAEGSRFSPPMPADEVESLVETLCWTGVLRRNTVPGTSFADAGYLI
ncbi:hypothetical protein GCM10007269_32070 [Microbacterium murale]|uniref:Calcineurin-like phosphoesterase domain-containing protein n=1 Tax=Microbacterium murale TaxID=1081040 RepID=A0ABQ1RY91_9MICO|nr:hypothetical protein GCM10007269_32070 [Microbacterium murale]